MSFIFHTGVKSDEHTTIAVLEYSETSEFYCWFVGWLVLIVLHEFWYFSSPTRDWTWAVRAQSPITGSPGDYPSIWFFISLIIILLFQPWEFPLAFLGGKFNDDKLTQFLFVYKRLYLSLFLKDSIDGHIFWSVGCLFVSALWIHTCVPAQSLRLWPYGP